MMLANVRGTAGGGGVPTDPRYPLSLPLVWESYGPGGGCGEDPELCDRECECE